MTKSIYIPTLREEEVSFITHMPGVFLGLGLTIVLLLKPNSSPYHQFSYLIYGITFMMIFAASAIYHRAQPGSKKQYLKKVDHACIYLFMAGCYTPFVVIKMLPTYQLYFICCVWLIAIFGASYKMISVNENRLISLTLYFSFGLMCFLAHHDLLAQLSTTSYILLAIGGSMYVFGVFFYLLNNIPFNHGIWHIFVLFGAITQFFAIYYI